MNASLDWPHPIYIRLARGGDPIISKEERGFEIGKAIEMTEPSSSRADVFFVTTGIATTQSLQAVEKLADQGVSCRLLHLHTIKPLDKAAILAAAGKADTIVTVEEHTLIGGLGSAVLELLADEFPGAMPPAKRLGIGDRFSKHYGSQQALMEMWGLDAEGIAASVNDFMKELELR